jgi:hypothetical protein
MAIPSWPNHSSSLPMIFEEKRLKKVIEIDGKRLRNNRP